MTLSQDEGELETLIDKELTQCHICRTDLCRGIYQCGLGLHTFCLSCVDRMPMESKPMESRPTRRRLEQAEYETFQSLVRGLHTSSGNIGLRYSNQTSARAETPPGSRPNLKRKRELSNQHFRCPFCASDTVYTRVKWLEHSLAKWKRSCKNRGCSHQYWQFNEQSFTQYHDCLFEPFACPVKSCEDLVPFAAQSIRDHLREKHGHREIEFEADHLTHLDLSRLETLGDELWTANEDVDDGECARSFLLTLSVESTNVGLTGGRLLRARGFDLSKRVGMDQDMSTFITGLVVCDKQGFVTQKYVIRYDPFQVVNQKGETKIHPSQFIFVPTGASVQSLDVGKHNGITSEESLS